MSSPSAAAPAPHAPSRRAPLPRLRWSQAWPWLAALLPWLILVNYLRLEWSANEQYSYGFVVPLLALYLVLQLGPTRPAPRPWNHPRWLLAVAVPLALLILPFLLLAEASPEWRLIGWFLAFIVTGLTICLILQRGGWPWVWHFAFPIFFMWTAVPWPTSVEFKVILPLMQMDAATAVEILNWSGIPAIQHQNIIELPHGTVGVDEACSGIRSLQTCLMIALFVGEWLRLGWIRRLVLLAAAMGLTYACNLIRTLMLVSLSAHLGKSGMQQWHDTAGLVILVISLLGLWALAALIRDKKPAALARAASPTAAAPWPRNVLLGFTAWFLLAVVGTQAWFDWHEAHAPPFVRWVVQWPRTLSTFETIEIPEDVRSTFLYDTGESSAAKWQELDSGTLWLGYFLRWKPGRETSIVASTHHPDVCLPASGKQLVKDFGVETFHVAGLDLPVEVYQFNDGGQPLFVFFCAWVDGHAVTSGPKVYPDADSETGVLATLRKIFLPFTPSSNLEYRLQAVAHGQRNRGQQIFELGVWGSPNVDDARQRYATQLNQLVTRLP